MPEQVAHIQVLEAVDAASPRSVSSIATELGLDLSNASRMVKGAVEAGYVTRRVASEDARRMELAPTAKGRKVLAQAHHWQEETFERLTAEWPKADAARFATYLERLANEVAE